MSNLYCRASASIKAQVGGHGELLKIIAAEKILKAEQKTHVKTQQDAMSATTKWADQEPDSFLRDALLRSLELQKTWIESQTQLASAMRVYRQTFEDILSQEKLVEPVLKAQKKAHKQEKIAEADQSKLRKKGENLEAIKVRLRNTAEARMAADLVAEEKLAALQQYKTTALKDGLLGISEAYLEYHEKAVVFFRAQRDIAALLPEDIFETDRDLTYRQELIDRANGILQDTDERLMKTNLAAQQRDVAYAGEEVDEVYRQYGSNLTATTWDSNEGLSGMESEEGDEIVLERDEFGHVYAKPSSNAGISSLANNKTTSPSISALYAKSPLRSIKASSNLALKATPQSAGTPKPTSRPQPKSMPSAYEHADAIEAEPLDTEPIYSDPPPRRGAPPPPPLLN